MFCLVVTVVLFLSFLLFCFEKCGYYIVHLLPKVEERSVRGSSLNRKYSYMYYGKLTQLLFSPFFFFLFFNLDFSRLVARCSFTDLVKLLCLYRK